MPKWNGVYSLYTYAICGGVLQAMCLRHGVGGTVGGTTPGKRAMGIKVVSCTQVSSVGVNRVRVMPATDLGFWR